MQDIIRNVQSKLSSIIYFDETCYLRERTSDLNTLIQFITEIELLYIEVHDELQYRVASMLGYLYRIYGLEDVDQLMKAQTFFNNCLAYSIEKQDIQKEITTLIRLGEVYKYQNQHEKALDLFEEAIMYCSEVEVNQSVDVAYQHLGKCLMEMKRYDEAERSLQLALQIRMKKGDAERIHSTRNALELNTLCREI